MNCHLVLWERYVSAVLFSVIFIDCHCVAQIKSIEWREIESKLSLIYENLSDTACVLISLQDISHVSTSDLRAKFMSS